MLEHAPHQHPTAHWRESSYLAFGEQTLRLAGDPETPADFSRAFSYLETITAHLLEFGPLEAKTAWDVAYELAYHNAWHQYEVEQERKAGEKQAEYRAIKLHHLRALSKRRVLALEETGWEETYDDKVVTHLDRLIEQALLEQEQLEQLMSATVPEYATPIKSSPNPSDNVPF